METCEFIKQHHYQSAFEILISFPDCGIPKSKSKIVGGSETKVNEYPWMVSMELNGNHACGGALISEDTIMTAAHCTKP